MMYKALASVFLLLSLPHIMVFAQEDSINNNLAHNRTVGGLADFGERLMDRLTWKGQRHVWVIYPAGGYSPRTGLEFGIMPVLSWRNQAETSDNGRPNTFSTSLQLSTKRMFEVRTEVEWFINQKWQLRSKFDYLKINDQFWHSFFNDGKKGLEYESNRLGFASEIFYGVSKQWFVGTSVQILNYEFKNWLQVTEPLDLFGQDGGLVAGLGPVLLIDGRDHVYYPRSGFLLKFGAIFHSIDYDFSNYLIDLRYYTSIRQSVVATQFVFEQSTGDVPFFMLPKLGGKERLRGIGHSQRIVDKSIWLLQSELRFPLWWRFGAVTFAGMGQASEHFYVNHNGIIYSGGAGLRFRILPDDPLNIRVDAALATGGLTGFFITLKEAF